MIHLYGEETVFYLLRVLYCIRLEFQKIIGGMLEIYFQIFLITASNLTLGLSHFCILRVTVVIFPKEKRRWRQTDHLTPPSL